ncbi:MAG: flagellin lysine-N-methylase [Clostridia bacterium]|nr:flagellin lysine-N-methylase [Clostridia bacterium]
MIIRKSLYFDKFSCIAAACSDSCCKEWQVELDDITAQNYLNLKGDLGERLRKVMYQDDGTWVFNNINDRCPMWRNDGLCRIQAELGEASLCNTCRQFPRLTHDYGDFKEYTLELSCPEAARLILESGFAPMQEEVNFETSKADYDTIDMQILLRTREKMLHILSDKTRPVGEVLALALLYGCQAQSELDGGKEQDFDMQSALNIAHKQAKGGNVQDIINFFKGLEILTPQWKERLKNPKNSLWQVKHLNLARYFVERYWLQAISDFDLYARVKFMIISCLLVKFLGGDIIETAQLYSKEIENNADNLEAIFTAAYNNPAFTDDKLLGLLIA